LGGGTISKEGRVNIANQCAVAIATYLQGEDIAHSPAVEYGISAALNESENARVIVVGNDAKLRKESLPGLYDINGEIHILQSVDEEDAETKLGEICDSINSIMGGKYGMPAILQGIDSDLHIYSYNWQGSQNVSGGKRQFGTIYNFHLFARNTSNTTS
jgi:hypothetical protein